jgi:hypothetical protein
LSALRLFANAGGEVIVPARVFLDREDGGHVIVHPPREVWERSELTPSELTRFSFLVAATGRAMIDALPQLEGGCVNYFEAGNWALHEKAKPAGPKAAREHRRMHLHIFGRSPRARHPAWKWGEAPKLPAWKDRHAFMARFQPLTLDECAAVAKRMKQLLATKYRMRR